MKRWNFGWSLLLAAAWASAGAPLARAQDTNDVTLDALVAEALEKNPELRFYEAEMAAAKAGRKTAGRLAQPEFSGSVGQKSVHDTGAEGVAWSVSVVQPFEWPGRIGLRKAIANHDIELAGLGYERFKLARGRRAHAGLRTVRRAGESHRCHGSGRTVQGIA